MNTTAMSRWRVCPQFEFTRHGPSRRHEIPGGRSRNLAFSQEQEQCHFLPFALPSSVVVRIRGSGDGAATAAIAAIAAQSVQYRSLGYRCSRPAWA